MRQIIWYAIIYRTVCVSLNLMCNGDFQVYSILANVTDSGGYLVGFGFQPSNTNCWYTQNPQTDFEVQTQGYAKHTKNV